MTITLLLLALTVISVWFKDLKVAAYALPLWPIFLVAALVSGVVHHYVELIGILWLAIFGLLSYLTKYTKPFRWIRAAHLVIIGLMALLIAMGKFPGFHNPDIVTDMRFTPEGLPFTHRLRIDGIVVGIILLAFFCQPAKSWNEWSVVLRKSPPIIFATLVVIFSCGLVLNYVSVDVKFIHYTLVFLVTNLLFTCVMEESFFRGFLQENVSQLLGNWKYGAAFSIALVALLFGAAHYQGGLLFIGLATLAGIFYGYAKYRVKHIEAAILTHFSVNAVHFVAFTYPNF